MRCLIQLRNGYLVSGSSDKTIKIWNIETSNINCNVRNIQTLSGHTSWVCEILELQNGNILSGSIMTPLEYGKESNNQMN